MDLGTMAEVTRETREPATQEPEIWDLEIKQVIKAQATKEQTKEDRIKVDSQVFKITRSSLAKDSTTCSLPVHAEGTGNYKGVQSML